MLRTPVALPAGRQLFVPFEYRVVLRFGVDVSEKRKSLVPAENSRNRIRLLEKCMEWNVMCVCVCVCGHLL